MAKREKPRTLENYNAIILHFLKARETVRGKINGQSAEIDKAIVAGAVLHYHLLPGEDSPRYETLDEIAEDLGLPFTQVKVIRDQLLQP